MDFLKRTLAPIPKEAWSELDEEARKVLMCAISARKIVDMTGPLGWGYAALSEGTLELAGGSPVEGLSYGTRKVTPMTEIRVPFTMPIWALDDIARGCKTVDYTPVQDAARKAALFEDMSIYFGVEDTGIVGLMSEAENKAIDVKLEDDAIVEAVVSAKKVLHDIGIGGPYALVAPYPLYNKIISGVKEYPLKKRVESVVDKIVLSPQLNACMLISTRGGDNELVIGQDFSIGYLSSTLSDVTFYITETLTFKCYNPQAFVPLCIE